MSNILMWASMTMILIVGGAVGGEAQALPNDSLQIAVHAASNEAVDGWEAVAPEAMPKGMPDDTLWISPDSVALTPAAWERIAFRLENRQPTMVVTPGAEEQESLRALLRDTPGQHVVILLEGTVRFASQVLSVEGTARSLRLMNVSPDEAAHMVRSWQNAHDRH